MVAREKKTMGIELSICRNLDNGQQFYKKELVSILFSQTSCNSSK